MNKPVMDEAHRQRRRTALRAQGFDVDALAKSLLEPEEEFGPQPFMTRDLFELHLHDTI